MIVKNITRGKKWLTGHARHQIGSVPIEIELEDGRNCHRYQDHIWKCLMSSESGLHKYQHKKP